MQAISSQLLNVHMGEEQVELHSHKDIVGYSEAQMYNNVDLLSGFFFKKEGIVLYGYIDRDLASKQFNVYLLDSQVLKVLLRVH